MRSMGDDGELNNSRLTSDHAFSNLIAKLGVRFFRHYVKCTLFDQRIKGEILCILR
jgi:hypothetical protein